MNRNKGEALRWLEQGLKDFKAAQWSKQGEFYAQACFLCQQSGEKLLKGYLYGQGERLILGHSLLELLSKCQTYQASLHQIDPDCRLLDRFYIPTRYPNGLPAGIPQTHYILKDAEEGLTALKRIIEAVKPLINNLPEQ